MFTTQAFQRRVEREPGMIDCGAYHKLVGMGVVNWEQLAMMSDERWADVTVMLKPYLGDEHMNAVDGLRSAAKWEIRIHFPRARLLMDYGVCAFISGPR